MTLAAVAALIVASPASARTPWETYLALPTSENARHVQAIEYSRGAIPEHYGYIASDLDILAIQVLSRDLAAFRLAYRLRNKADGGLLEELTTILGRTIRAHPELFLREMASLSIRPGALRSILQMPGLVYVDRPDARRYEIEMRRRALARIDRSDLLPIRDRCLEALRPEGP